MSGTIHLVKLCVGAARVEDLEAWQARRRRETGLTEPRHVTRMWPRREAELLNGGALYWVFRGAILARQRILALEETIGQDGVRRCAIVLDRALIRTRPAPRRAFQGWRYLPPEDAPADLPGRRAGDDILPAPLSAELAAIGIL